MMILFLEVRLDYKCLNNLSASGNIKNRQSYLLFAMLCACVCVLNLTTGRYEERLWVVSGSWTHRNRVLQVNTHTLVLSPQVFVSLSNNQCCLVRRQAAV